MNVEITTIANFPINQLLAIGSFSIAIAGLLIRIFYPSGPKKETLIITVIAFLVLLSGITLWERSLYNRRVEGVATEIVKIIGNEIMTFDQVHEALYKVDFAVANEAIDKLIGNNRLGYRLLELRDDFGNRFRTRGYFVREISEGK